MQNKYPLILVLDITGTPKQWITHEVACTYYVKGLVAWSMGSIDYQLSGGIQRKTGQQSTINLNTIIALKGNVSKKTLYHNKVAPLSNHTLFKRDNYICAYCNTQYKRNKLSKDHIIPTSKGGKNSWVNLITACRTCNGKKKDKTPDEANMPLLYAPYIPNYAEYLLYSNKRILEDQRIFLNSFIKDVDKRQITC